MAPSEPPGEGEGDILEINDYSQATAFEKTVGKVEKVLREWGRVPQDGAVPADQAAVDFEHNGIPVTLRYTHGEGGGPGGVGGELMDAGADFAPSGCPIPRLFGPCRYAVISPADYTAVQEHPDLTESLLSLVCLAAANARVGFPCFVEDYSLNAAQLSPYAMYTGRAAGNVVTSFSCEYAACVPEHCTTLDGLLDLFYRNLLIRETGTEVAVRYSYKRRIYNPREWRHLMDVENGGVWGTTEDPLLVLQGQLVWPKTRDTLVDNTVWSAFDPLCPPLAKVEVTVADGTRRLLTGRRASHADGDDAPGTPSCTLGESVRQMIDVYLDAVYGNAREDRQYTPIPYFSRARQGGGGWRAALSHSVRSLSGGQAGSDQPAPKHGSKEHQRIRELAHDVLYGADGVVATAETRPAASFASALAAQAQTKGVHSVTELRVLNELVVDYFTRCWDTLTPIPHTPLGDFSENTVSAFDQCVQQLNCCIDGASRAAGPARESAQHPSGDNGWESDDRSFGTVESAGEDRDAGGWGSDGSFDDPELSAQRKGVKSVLKGMRCRGGYALHVPHTQVAIPATDDDAHRREDHLTSLGASEAATHTRMCMHADGLFSDMQAFKAANPQDTLEFADFLKWYSPGDVVDSASNVLSVRMQDDGNLWQRLWSEAVALPAGAQPPLVDFEAQGVLALKALRDLPLAKVAQCLANHAIANGFALLRGASKAKRIGTIRDRFDTVAQRFQRDAARLAAPARLDGYASALHTLDQFEVALCLASSVWDRFMSPITEHATAERAVNVIDKLVLALFDTAVSTGGVATATLTDLEWQAVATSLLPDGTYDGSLDHIRQPDTREFIVRCTGDRHAAAHADDLHAEEDVMFDTAEPCAHRMYAAIHETEGFLVCLSTSEKTVY